MSTRALCRGRSALDLRHSVLSLKVKAVCEQGGPTCNGAPPDYRHDPCCRNARHACALGGKASVERGVYFIVILSLGRIPVI